MLTESEKRAVTYPLFFILYKIVYWKKQEKYFNKVDNYWSDP